MITILHPVKRQINQYYYLKSLIESYRYYVEEWVNKTLKDIEAEAIASSEGEDDKEIAVSIYNSVYSQGADAIYEQTDSENLLFYKAMLIIVYSYYEGIINKMAEDAGTQGRPSIICGNYGKVLSKESTDKVAFLFDYILPLRNHLCHNDSGTKDKDYEKAVKALKYLNDSGYIEMNYQTDSEGQVVLEKCSIYYIKKDFIIDVLDMEHDILIELSEIAGYKNKYIGKR